MATDLPVVYSQNPRPVGFPLAFRLVGERLAIDSTRKVEEVALSGVETVRLTFEPRSLARRAFKTKVTMADGRGFALTSVSWKGMTRVDEQRAEYRAFVTALLAAIARANPGARFLAGKPAPVWYGIVALAGLSAIGVTLFVVRAFLASETGAGLFGLLIAAGGFWQAGPFVLRNRPQTFSPDAAPAEVLP